MLLRHSAGLEEDALAIEAAVNKVLAAGHRTSDIARPSAAGKPAAAANITTHEMGKLVHEALAQSIDKQQSLHAV
jgi:3-isopropylmalate dehydrogenase